MMTVSLERTDSDGELVSGLTKHYKLQPQQEV